MPLKTTVKVSHISNLSDARYCAGMGVDMLGFQAIAGSERYMPPQRFQDIRGWISGPRIIAELYGVTRPAEIASVIETYAPDYLELTLTEFQNFKDDLSLPCIVCVSTDEMASIKPNEKIAYLLVNTDTHCGDITGVASAVLARIASLADLNEKISEGCFQGFVLEGPHELRPGVTNYEQLGNILEALEED
jgi:phosphoribosylanthranilate isomerase